MVWSLRLNITNGTDRPLTVSGPELRWGWWYTNNKDNTEPVSIPPGKTVYALGIRASSGTWTGYECACSWIDATTDKESYGAISVEIDVPFTADNASSIHVSGVYQQSGWTDLPKRGHNFTRNMTITTMDGKLVAELDEETEDDPDYLRFLEMEVAANEMIQHWPELVKELPEVNQFDPQAVMPDKYLYPPKEFFIARGEVVEIDTADWSGIGDPKYTTAYAKKQFAKRYFAVPVYSINTDPRAVEQIPPGVKKTHMRSVEVTSVIKSTLETNWSIKASLSAEGTNVATTAKVAASLESAFSIRNVREESTQKIEKEETTIEIAAVDYDRLFVPWVFSTAAAIYCEDKKGNFRLVAISQWALLQLFKVYKSEG